VKAIKLGQNLNNRKFLMKRNEKEEAKRDGAKPVKNSGRGYRKGDATLGDFVLDYKHNGSSFNLTRKNWIKMRKDAWNSNYKHPCISVVLGEDSDVKVAIIEWELFKQLISEKDDE
jgi:hypothetical protein